MKLRSIALVTAAAIAGAAGSPAFAQGSADDATRAELSADLENNFKSIDVDGDGSVTKDEIAAAQQKMLKQANAAIEKKFADEFHKLDTDKNGQLSLAEFSANAPHAKPKTAAESRLDRFDADNDGKITLKEFRDPVLANFDKIDTNRDGKLSEAEQKKALAARGR